MMQKLKLLFVGCGKMGGALLSSIITHNDKYDLDISIIDSNFVLTDKLRDLCINKGYNISVFLSLENYPCSLSQSGIDVLFFGIKPQNSLTIIEEYKNIVGKNTIIVSMLAGKKMEFFSGILGDNKKIVRIMPNLPALVGMGAITGVINDRVHQEDLAICSYLLNLGSKFILLDNENLIDVSTAISGSGPAYIFLFAEIMITKAIKLGLSEEVAKQLVVQTFTGSSNMMQESNENIDVLRSNVTSKGGTTEVALSVLMQQNNLSNLIEMAIDKALERAREL